ncbi:DUF4115 domain-containing protein [Erythrobacter pelagi]|jgi:transcriptional regulator with XRE-family HTH domain|uniref:DUF4115 domain-containing protein n=1 Tax=Qipengyuania pelagi TaxID=994320 RepID=A0A844Y9W4_9SPHN|nr:helix-turn-helix domain-containing protein [Qipengyuania pelagi]MXO54177.1 DUF4115 domain-containing protein [Qipengyuania pelagi]
MQDETRAGLDGDGHDHGELPPETAQSGAPQTAGGQLRAAREARGLDLSQVAAETRIPQRHLENIEAGEYGNLPSRTYAIGFARSYARMLDLDERSILDQVRAELAQDETQGRAAPAKFEPGDPARVPSGKLAWLGALAAVLLLVGGFAFYRTYFSPGLGPAPLAEETQVAAAETGAAPDAPATPAIDPNAEVVFTSEMPDTWVKFYDASGAELYQAQMGEGESFTIPRDAEGPQVWTGRPYALAITVGGRPVPKLSEEDEIVRDVPVSAEALLTRGQAGSAAPGATPSPATSSGPTPAGTPIATQTGT